MEQGGVGAPSWAGEVVYSSGEPAEVRGGGCLAWRCPPLLRGSGLEFVQEVCDFPAS